MKRVPDAISALAGVALLGLALCGCGSAAGAALASPRSSSSAKPALDSGDPMDPRTWAMLLRDPAQETTAAARLLAFFENAQTEDGGKSGPHSALFVDQLIGPLTEACTKGRLQQQARSTIIEITARARDQRAVRCWIDVLDSYRAGQDAKNVATVMRAIAQAPFPETADAVVRAFSKWEAAAPTSKRDQSYRDVQRALLAVASPAQEEALIALLRRPFPAAPRDRIAADNEIFWQANAALALGNLHSEKSIPALIGALLPEAVVGPGKSSSAIGASALGALIKIGKPAVAPAADLLKGSDVSTGARILGTIGREDCGPPLLAALTGADEPTRVTIALELAELPPSPANLAAFKAVFERTSVGTQVPGGSNALEALTNAARQFYDPTLVPWLLQQAARLQGDPEEIEAVRQHIVVTCIALMQADQIMSVKRLYDSAGANGKGALGAPFEREFDAARTLIDSCKNDASCYRDALVDAGRRGPPGYGTGIKAAFMIAIVDPERGRAKLVQALPDLAENNLVAASVMAIEFLSPRGDPAVAARLSVMADESANSGAEDEVAARQIRTSLLRESVIRLQTRAQ